MRSCQCNCKQDFTPSSARAFCTILEVFRVMVREMTLRHFFPSLLPLFTASSAVTPSATWDESKKNKKTVLGDERICGTTLFKSVKWGKVWVNLCHWHKLSVTVASQSSIHFSLTRKPTDFVVMGFAYTHIHAHPHTAVTLKVTCTPTHTCFLLQPGAWKLSFRARYQTQLRLLAQ